MQKGFIQISVLIAIIIGLLVLGGGGYFGVKQYQEHQQEKLAIQEQQQKIEDEKIKLAEAEGRAKEEETKEFMELQKNALEEAQLEIEKLKEDNAQTKQNQSVLEKSLQNVQNQPPKDTLFITSSDLSSYLTGVVRIECDGEMGSGSLWNFSDAGYSVLTNKHVIERPYSEGGQCNVFVDSSERSKKSGDFYTIGLYTIFPKTGISSSNVNRSLDIKALKMKDISIGESINSLNYNISQLQKCINEMPVGSPVVVVGYPAFTQKDVINILGGIQTEAARTITNGVISAYDSTVTGYLGNLPYSNYYVSAKIDSGNSGGIAFAKDEGGLCVLGVPTWLTVGNYETQGLVQNIHNVMYVSE